MADEKAEEKKEEVKEEPQKAEKAPEQKSEKAHEKKAEKAPAQTPQAGTGEAAPAKKLRKISQMTLQEIEKELVVVKEKMGGFQSRFARHLLARKKELSA